MLRFLLRMLSLVALSVAVIMAVLDATRSLALSAVVLTPLAESWAAVSPDTLLAARSAVEQALDPLAWQILVAPLLALPGFVVFALLSFLLAALGRRSRRVAGRFAT